MLRLKKDMGSRLGFLVELQQEVCAYWTSVVAGYVERILAF